MTTPSDDAPNEILAAAREHKARAKAAAANAPRRRNWPKLGLGAAIGSAAIASAVLFANRDRRER